MRVSNDEVLLKLQNEVHVHVHVGMSCKVYIVHSRLTLPAGSKNGTCDYTVSSMSILCLGDIQLTFDWVGIEPRGT